MTDEQKPRRHPKDRVPPEEGIVIPAEELERVNDRMPAENVDPAAHEGPIPAKRPTDGPL
jgi:hypothetical protein